MSYTCAASNVAFYFAAQGLAELVTRYLALAFALAFPPGRHEIDEIFGLKT